MNELSKKVVLSTMAYPTMSIESRIQYYLDKPSYEGTRDCAIGCGGDYIQIELPISTSEAITHIANAIQDGFKFTSLVMQTGLQNIANSIISSSNMLCSSLDKIENEMERQNKLEEYYRLLEKIDMYEDFLIEKAMLEEVYQKMHLTEMPIIDLQPQEIAMIAQILNEENISVFKRYVQNTTEHPRIILYNIIFDSLFYGEGKCYSCIEKKSLPISLENAVKNREKISVRDENWMEKQREANDCIKKEIWRFLATLSEECKDTKYQITDKYVDLKNLFENVNRDRILTNLRGLHSNLRMAVRDVKINRKNC